MTTFYLAEKKNPKNYSEIGTSNGFGTFYTSEAYQKLLSFTENENQFNEEYFIITDKGKKYSLENFFYFLSLHRYIIK